MSFADKLKELAAEVDPIITVYGAHLSAALRDHGNWEEVKDLHPEARTFLQNLGTGVRNVLGEDTWVNAALEGLHPDGEYVVTDVRFRNEAHAIKRHGGELWRVARPNVGPANDHVSEVGLDDWSFDRYITNDKDLDYLRDLTTLAGGMFLRAQRHMVIPDIRGRDI